MNPNNNPLYRYQMKHLIEKSNYNNNSDGSWKTILGIGLAIATISFYNNLKSDYKILKHTIEYQDSVKDIKKDSLEYKINDVKQ